MHGDRPGDIVIRSTERVTQPQRVVPHTLVAPLRRSGGVRGGVVAWAVMLVRVGVSALRLWAEWQGQDDTLWLALTNRQWPPHRTHWQLWLPPP